MKLRTLSIFAIVMAVVAIGAWIWSGGDGVPPVGLATPDASTGTKTAQPASVTTVPTPSARPAQGSTAESSPATSPPAEPVRMTSSVSPGTPLVRTVPAPLRAASPAAAGGPVSRPEREIDGKAEIGKVQSMLRDFRTRMGENPVGSNAEIMKAVMGGNEVKARLGPPEGQELNEQGELLDHWGTPYFFHQLSKNSTEVRSAGPDRKMWTSDDLITK